MKNGTLLIATLLILFFSIVVIAEEGNETGYVPPVEIDNNQYYHVTDDVSIKTDGINQTVMFRNNYFNLIPKTEYLCHYNNSYDGRIFTSTIILDGNPNNLDFTIVGDECKNSYLDIWQKNITYIKDNTSLFIYSPVAQDNNNITYQLDWQLYPSNYTASVNLSQLHTAEFPVTITYNETIGDFDNFSVTYNGIQQVSYGNMNEVW